jgi:hypothetical protein
MKPGTVKEMRMKEMRMVTWAKPIMLDGTKGILDNVSPRMEDYYPVS